MKIIASALNFRHCGEIVAAYRARNRRADYVHSREDSADNERVMQKLENDQLDVIVQVRKLGEGFDHPLLAVAAVFSIFANLSPFVQFVGRIMRVIKLDAPGDPLNNGVVVFHAGANIARRWQDFQQFSKAERDYFDQLLPIEGLDFTSGDEIQIDPLAPSPQAPEPLDVRGQTDVRLQEIPLIKDDPAALAALKTLQEKGYSPDQVKEAYQALQPIPVTKVGLRQAKRAKLDMAVKTEAARILAKRGINPKGQDLDRKRLGRTNLIVMKAAIDRQVNAAVGRKAGERRDFTRPQLDQINSEFAAIVQQAVREVFNAKN
ncbi:MAG: helicase-related protein [Terriglobia bacterium]